MEEKHQQSWEIQQATTEQDSLLESVSFAATSFLDAENWRDHINSVLAHFGKNLKVSRIYIFQNFSDEKGLYMSQQYEWVKEGITPQIDNPDLKKLHYADSGLNRLIKVMSAGKAIKGLVKDLPDNERMILEAQDIITIFLTPIFVKDEWWGFIGFDECEHAREWTSTETNMLITAAGIFTSALENESYSHELKEISRNFRTIFDNSPDAIFIYSSSGHLLDVNESGCHLNGISRENMLGIHYLQLVPEESRENAPDLFEKLKSGRGDLHVTYALHVSGDKIPVEIRATRTVFSNQQALLLQVRDIGERLQNEQLLKHRLEFIQFISQISSNFIKIEIHRIDEAIEQALEYVCNFTGNERGYVFQPDDTGNIMLLTHEYCKPEFKAHRGLLDSFHTDEFSDFLDTLRSGNYIITHFDEIPGTPENENMREILSLLEIKSFINIPLIIGSKFIGYIGFDATERKTHWDEDTINAFMLTGQIIANATVRKQSEKEIMQAKEKAEESDKLKTTFLGQMSHELRTPLNSILGFAGILEKEISTPELREMASYITKGGSRLLNTLNLLIDLSQLESNLLQPDIEEINLNKLLHELKLLFSHHAAEQGLHFRLEEKATGIKIAGDLNHVEKILYNLLDNAFKYTREGFVKVSIAKVKYGQNNWAEVRVTDSGIGIAPERQPFIFERFRQASEGYNREFEGAGLGLAVTKKMVQMMHGEITLESRPGKGSCFIVRLPLHSTAPEPKVTVKEEEELESPPKRSYKILIAEDEVTHQKYLEYILSGSYQLQFAANGTQALQLAREHDFAAILLDINLGKEMNGLELLREMRKIPFHQRTPVAAVTANVLKGDEDKLLREGFDYYLAKPFRIKEVKLLVEKMIRQCQ